MLHSTVGHYNQMYNMPEFNQINKEDTMSQGTKGSTKLMIAVWAIVMLFIGFKALIPLAMIQLAMILRSIVQQ